MTEACNELRTALAQQQAAGKTVEVFFRDDDVDEDEATLRRLLHLFAERNVPVILGVIPAHLTDTGIALLQQFSASVELVQHGWQHVNHEATGRKCEFGASRSFDEQFDDLLRGRTRMIEAFGEHWFRAFIPPWNRCTEVTYQALEQLGFRVLSVLHDKHSPRPGFAWQELSVTLDLYRWQEGAQFKPAEEILADFVQQLQAGAPLGIMLHHKVMTEEAFAFLEALLDELQQFSAVRFHRFQTLLQVA